MKFLCGINQRHDRAEQGRMPDHGECRAEYSTWEELAHHINTAHRCICIIRVASPSPEELTG